MLRSTLRASTALTKSMAELTAKIREAHALKIAAAAKPVVPPPPPPCFVAVTRGHSPTLVTPLWSPPPGTHPDVPVGGQHARKLSPWERVADGEMTSPAHLGRGAARSSSPYFSVSKRAPLRSRHRHRRNQDVPVPHPSGGSVVVGDLGYTFTSPEGSRHVLQSVSTVLGHFRNTSKPHVFAEASDRARLGISKRSNRRRRISGRGRGHKVHRHVEEMVKLELFRAAVTGAKEARHRVQQSHDVCSDTAAADPPPVTLPNTTSIPAAVVSTTCAPSSWSVHHYNSVAKIALRHLLRRYDAVATEAIIASPELGLAGRADFIGRCKITGRLLICDFKTRGDVLVPFQASREDTAEFVVRSGPLQHLANDAKTSHALQVLLLGFLMRQTPGYDKVYGDAVRNNEIEYGVVSLGPIDKSRLGRTAFRDGARVPNVGLSKNARERSELVLAAQFVKVRPSDTTAGPGAAAELPPDAVLRALIQWSAECGLKERRADTSDMDFADAVTPPL